MTSTARSVSDGVAPIANRTNGHTEPASHDAPLTSRSTAGISLRQAALASGLGLLLLAILAAIVNFGVLQKLIVAGDAQSTAQNIATAQGLFRLAIGGFFAVAILDVVVAWGLYYVFEPVNRSLSVLAALFRVVYATMFGIAVNNLLTASQVVGGADFLKAFGTDQAQAQMMVLLGAFQSGWDLALIVFGLHLFVLGILVFRSGKTGLRVVGILVTIAGVGYLIDGVGKVLVPNYSLTIAMYTFVGEPLLMLWLLWKAIRGFRPAAPVSAQALA
jgi:Domain of unknown function (DUF4386)